MKVKYIRNDLVVQGESISIDISLSLLRRLSSFLMFTTLAVYIDDKRHAHCGEMVIAMQFMPRGV